MPIDFNDAIVFCAGGVVGFLCRQFIEHRLAISRNMQVIKVTEFNKAAVEFQCAVLEAKQRLRDDPKADWHSILNSTVLLEHERAALRFKTFLTVKERAAFDKDWNAYFSHRPHPGERHAPEKTPEEWGNKENCKKCIEQIDMLLSHAKLR